MFIELGSRLGEHNENFNKEREIQENTIYKSQS